MCFSTRLGPPGADRHALNRRVEAAAKTSAAAYQRSGELVVGCACIGQPRDEEEPVPQVDECIRDPDLWALPQRPDRIRLAFLWYIAKRGQEDWGHELAWSCVVRLDHAERKGVPLPADFAPDVDRLFHGLFRYEHFELGVGRNLDVSDSFGSFRHPWDLSIRKEGAGVITLQRLQNVNFPY